MLILLEYRDETLKKKTSTRRSQAQASGARTAGNADEKPVALTLKVDQSTYVRLRTLVATKRRSSQDILLQLLQEYLDLEKS